MGERECTEFLQWCLPRLRFRWAGFRRVRKQVCKRIHRRAQELGLHTLAGYREYLGRHAPEWDVLDSFCQITISRFYRDVEVFDQIGTDILPCLSSEAALRGEKDIRCWCAGCCRGEEAYTLQILWRSHVISSSDAPVRLLVIATDADENLLKQAREGCFRKSSLKDLPETLRRDAFETDGGQYRVRPAYGKDVEFLVQDIRKQMPTGTFHMVLCRNLAFTYYEESLQREVLGEISRRLLPRGLLVIGARESLPDGVNDFVQHGKARGIYRKAGNGQGIP